MNCETFREQVFEFLQGTLPASPEFDRHQSSCASCDAMIRGIRRNERALGGMRTPTAPPDLWPRIAAAIGRERVRPYRGLRVSAFWASAAAVLLAVVAVSSPGSPRRGPKIDLVVQEVGPELQRTFRSFVPRYEDVDAATAMVDTLFRSEY